MRIVFFGTPAFAIPSFAGLLRSGHEVVSVVTQPDRKVGRHRVLTAPPVKELAVSKGIRVLQPEKMKDPMFLEELSRIQPDVIVVVAYGKILPPQILRLPPHGCINVHASLLPKYRGAAPIQWAIIRGEKETGITTMLMNEGLDTGDILLQESMDIRDDDTYESLSRRLSEVGAALLLKTMDQLETGKILPAPQSGTPTFAPPLMKEDGLIDWSKTAGEISDIVRGMYPWPGAYCLLAGERIKITKVRTAEGCGKAGRIESAGRELIVGTGNGLISILELQPEGKRVMDAGDFVQGRRLKAGISFDGR